MDDLIARCRRHVMERITAQPVITEPFHHLFIEEILPPDIYAALHAHMLEQKHGSEVQARRQDNPEYTNSRFNLVSCGHPIVECVRATFSDPQVRAAALRKFYAEVTPELVESLSLHHEFEYTFTKAGRFQNIHIDIPPKFLSFVLYMPEATFTPEEERQNATIVYDKELRPHYSAKCARNSICIFAPHFHSYHGFASTQDRDVLVMFYVSQDEYALWREARKGNPEAPPFDTVRDAIECKLLRWPLIEFGSDPNRIARERAACRVNAPLGRVLG